jgi:GNAT superfamily N-acetyltransferase
MNEIKDEFQNKIGNIKFFVVARKEYWNVIQQNLLNLPFQTNLIDPSTEQGHDFVNSMIELNEAAYGKGMAAPAWTFANFGTIGAGITGGVMIDNVPISKFSVVGDLINPQVSHEWTLLTHPDFQGKGLGKLTLALALQVSAHKSYHTFIMQTDNNSNLIYLQNPHPLQVLAYGFIHTRRNSFLIKTKIPNNPFESFLSSKREKYSVGEITNDGDFWVKSNEHEKLMGINSEINNGATYTIKDWVFNPDGENDILLNKNG